MLWKYVGSLLILTIFRFFFHIGSFGDPVFQWIGNQWIQVGVASYYGMNGKLGYDPIRIPIFPEKRNPRLVVILYLV